MEDHGRMISEAHNNASKASWDQASEASVEALDGDDRQRRQAAYKEDALDSTCHQTQDDLPHANVAVEQTTRALCHRERLKEGHLRLVRVLTETAGNFIQCETKIVSVLADEKYTALSYAWGPPIATHAIMLDGERHMLPENLWQFLTEWKSELERADQEHDASEDYLTRRYLARRVRDRWEANNLWLWVDALSIDQSNMQERMHQVRIMSRIFIGAERVFIWLGPTNNQVDDLMQWFISGCDSFGELRLRRNHVAGFRDLCERSYWSRLWIFPELKSAKHIALMFGSHTLNWKEFDLILSKLGGPNAKAYLGRNRHRPNGRVHIRHV